MKNLTYHKLSDFCKTGSGGTPSRKNSDYFNGNIPWIKSGELKNTIIIDSEEKISESALKDSSAKLIPKNTILIAMYGATVGQLGILGVEAATNQAICYIIPDPTICDRYYLFRFLQSNLKRFLHQRVGGAQPNISQNIIKTLKVPLPLLSTQQKITSILEKAESAKEKRKEANRLTEEFLKSVFLEMFGDPVRNPKRWKVKNISEICNINPRLDFQISDETEVTFMPMSTVSAKGEIDTRHTKKYSEVKSGFTYFLEGDVIFAKITPCMENGKGAIVKNLKNGIGFGSTEFHVLRPMKEIKSEWLYLLLSFKHIREIAAKNMTGTAGQKRVPASFFKNFKIAVPPLSLQQKFADIVQKVEILKEKQKESERELDNLFNCLMQKAFKG